MYPVPTPVNVRHVIREDESILGWALTNDSCLKEKGYLERQLTKTQGRRQYDGEGIVESGS